MKTLKYILFLLLILIVGFLIYVAVQPNEYDIKRTQLINAPANVIYDNINDIKKYALQNALQADLKDKLQSTGKNNFTLSIFILVAY